jgi:tetratricopeptide (TPR) repeat protein
MEYGVIWPTLPRTMNRLRSGSSGVLELLPEWKGADCKIDIVAGCCVSLILMFPWFSWLCAALLIGSGMAADVPFVFGEGSRDVAGFTSTQLEQASSGSPDLAGVPQVFTPSCNEVLELPIVGGGNAPGEKTETKEEDLKKTVSSRVEPDHSTVHEVALLLVAKFPGDLTIDQICSIYSYMKNGEGSVKGWSYARDPRGSDFFMYANQSLKIGGKASCSGVGDCDDFAILMSALVESIGGTTRIIFAQNKTVGGHAYAEVYLGNINDQNSQVNEILGWLEQRFNSDKIYTHIDTDTKGVWLNLDWGEDEKGIAHPGGPFCQGERHIVVCSREQYAKTSLKLSATTKEGVELSPAISLNITTDEIESKSAEVWFNKGFALNSLGKYDEGIIAYDEAIRLNPYYAAAWNNKGIALDNQGKHDESIKAYDEAIRLDPNDADARNNKGTTLGRDLGNYDEAILAFDEAIRLDPNHVKAWSNKGIALVGQGNYEEALRAYEEAIRLDPNLVEPWNNKGIASTKLGRYEEAIRAFDEAIRLDPSYAKSWNNKGGTLGQQGKYGEAIKACDEAIRLDPSYAMAWSNKGNALVSLGKYDEALQAYDEAIRLDPSYLVAWTNKGEALKAIGRVAESNAAYAKAKEMGYNGQP